MSETVSNRQLRVGESIRRVLIEIMTHDLYDPIFEHSSLTVSEVKMSPDLKTATAYVLPLIGTNTDRNQLLMHLQDLAPKLRYLVSNKIELRSSPEIKFKLDTSFDQAAKIDALLKL